MTTLAPSATKRLAVAKPMPLLPPVITATFPSSVFVIIVLLLVATLTRIFGLEHLAAKPFHLTKFIVVGATQCDCSGGAVDDDRIGGSLGRLHGKVYRKEDTKIERIYCNSGAVSLSLTCPDCVVRSLYRLKKGFQSYYPGR
jgi:hypothetical protein